LVPSPAAVQLRLAVWANSRNRKVVLVPSVTSAKRMRLFRKATPS
jgi:hypothetical protein